MKKRDKFRFTYLYFHPEKEVGLFTQVVRIVILIGLVANIVCFVLDFLNNNNEILLK